MLGATVVVLAVACGAALFFTGGTVNAATAYRQATARTGTIRLTTATAGTLEPAQLANLNFAVSGQVTGVSVQVGQHVTAGQVLATVTSASLAAQVAQARATLANDKAKATADRNGSARSAQVTADDAAVTAAQASLANTESSLSEATLKSTVTGTVAQLNLLVGEQVPGGSGNGSNGSGNGSSSSSAEVVVVGSAYLLNASVDDTQIGLMKKGQQAVILPQGATKPVDGTVTSVGLLAAANSGVASFPVVVSVTGTPTGLYAGASATVTIVYRELSDVVEVPTAAVRYTGGKASVLRRQGTSTVSVPVTVGVTSGGFTQITAGLSDGQTVLIATRPAAASTAGTGGGGRNRGGLTGGGGLGGTGSGRNGGGGGGGRNGGKAGG